MIATRTLKLLMRQRLITVFGTQALKNFLLVLHLFQVVGQSWLVFVLRSVHWHKVLGFVSRSRTRHVRWFMHLDQWLWNLSGVTFILIADFHLIWWLLLGFRFFFKFNVAYFHSLFGVRRNLRSYRRLGLKYFHWLDVKDGFRFGIWVGRLLVLDHVNRQIFSFGRFVQHTCLEGFWMWDFWGVTSFNVLSFRDSFGRFTFFLLDGS